MRNIILLIAFSCVGLIAQSNVSGVMGIPAISLSGTGSPASSINCNAASGNIQYIQTDATSGRLWICDFSTGSWAWDHMLNTLVGTATTGAITAGSFILGGCTSIVTVTVAGAVVGTNSAAASPVFATAPTGNVALLNIIAWVSAANTVSVQGCAIGTLGSVPNFTAKVLVY